MKKYLHDMANRSVFVFENTAIFFLCKVSGSGEYWKLA